jgi:hypothetical protein
LYLSSDSNKTTNDSAAAKYQEDNTINTKNPLYALNKYKSNKVIWVELEPGKYTLEVVCLLQTGGAPNQAVGTIIYQLYMKLDLINVSREDFIPPSLNFFGLLGWRGDTRDFGQTVLFYDDVTLWKEKKETTFRVMSEMASISIQLE